MAKVRVAVIGAGSAGLGMCKYLADEPQLDFVAFEKSNKVGGLWRYTKDDQDREICHTAMYKNLRTNLPKEIMAYPEVPFPEHLPSFITSEDVVQYLEDYADRFDLRKYIKFQHEVILVKPCQNKDQLTWQVVSKDLTTGGTKNGVFDAVVVCNGHFSVPKIPEIPGMDGFPGNVIHSVDYKDPEDFKDQTVVILGAGNSGLDVCLQISEFAKEVYLVHRDKKIPCDLPGNVEETIGSLTSGFPDGSVEINHEYRRNVNSVVFCTGYHYSLPFLAPECQIEVRNDRVTSLYKHVFNTAHPSLSFVGLCRAIAPFPNYSAQAQWITSVLTGRNKLPSREEMISDEEMDYQKKLSDGLAEHRMHTLGAELHESYNNELASLCDAPSLPPGFHSLFRYIYTLRAKRLMTYKNTNFVLNRDNWYEVNT